MFWKSLALFVLLCSSACFTEQCNNIQEKLIQEKLHKLPEHDKKILDRFFEEIVINHSFGYTIFGNKPMSLAGCFSNLPYYQSRILRQSYTTLLTGITSWQRHKIDWPSKNFIFKFQKHLQGNRIMIYLINKKAVLEVVQQHIDLFCKVLQRSITPDQLLQELCREDTTVEEVLHDHEGLKGILLGYGVQNAFLYQRKEEISRRIDQSGLADEYDKIQQCFDRYHKYYQLLSPFPLPAFCKDIESNETKDLLESYAYTRKTLIKAYANKNFLEVTLCKMLEE